MFSLRSLAKSEINLRKSTYKTVPKATATMQKVTQKSTESKTPESTKYDDDNTTMQRASVSESMSSGATTYEIKENIHTNMKRINQVVRREVAKERKKLKKEEYQRRKAQYRTRIPAPPVYVAPSPIPSFYYRYCHMLGSRVRIGGTFKSTPMGAGTVTLGGRVRIGGTFKTTPVGAGTVTLGWQSPHRWNF
ncbi:uncharacterized protein LOC112639421 [Camponotus floridanus]|uniref:uncharacterized protein LOC112639421 n=1 Tax=Camponotus floridanus TaxID=104421 RepID=UPI000DC68299|nr:uncharacterized protein LOC112639421 [Camponotus floridanus]